MIAEYKAARRKDKLQDAIRQLHNSFKMRKPAIPPDLSYLEGAYREDYLHDMRLCQHWAKMNRNLIANLIMDYFISQGYVELKQNELAFESVHNYIGDDNIIRKGAIAAYEGQKCIIPLNMRDGSLICIGKGNADWNCSAPHGAGRIMSRSQAFRSISMWTTGLPCRAYTAKACRKRPRMSRPWCTSRRMKSSKISVTR